MLAPTLAHFVSLRRTSRCQRQRLFGPSQPAQAGSEPLALSPTGGNTSGPAKPVPRCFWKGPRVVHASQSKHRVAGFTLIELLVAIGIMALLALMSWRGLDGMAQAQAANRTRGDAMLTLQTTLTQWNADLDAVLQLGAGTSAIDWDGRVLRLTRRGTDPAEPAVQVVAWTLRTDADGARWRRWQSPPFSTRAGWRQAWMLAASWGQDGASEARRSEVALLPLESWQLYYFRNGAWSPAVGADALGGLAPVPDGVRLVLSLPPGPSLAGLLTRDWVRPNVAVSKT